MLRIYDRKGKSMIAQAYDGQYFPYPLTSQDIGEHLSEMRNMPTREDDVLISSYPKSGTHWLFEAVHMLMNNCPEYSLKDFPSTTGKADGLPLLEYLLINELESVKSPRLMLSHLKPKYIPKDFNGKIIHLTRNPKDVAVSYYTFIRNHKMVEYDGEWDDFIPLFIEGKVIWGSLFEYEKEWKDFSTTLSENRILYVSYEELHKDFVSSLAKVAVFLGMQVNGNLLQQIYVRCDINSMRKSRLVTHDVYADSYIQRTTEEENTDALYRKGIVGDGKHWFTVDQNHSGPIYSHRPYPIQPVYPVPCPMVCQISCPFGNVLDERGCPICRCLPVACILPKSEGPCLAAFSRYFYNKKTSRCEHFIWGGCKPNKNNFQTFHECQATCGGKSSVSN